jgi:hypothetical protein
LCGGYFRLRNKAVEANARHIVDALEPPRPVEPRQCLARRKLAPADGDVPVDASKPRRGALHGLAKRRFVLIARPVAIGSADPPIHAPAATASTFVGEQIREGGPQVGRDG